MAIQGLITNAGLSAAQDASSNEGFRLVPTRFGVSDVSGALDATRTAATAGLFFDAPISSRVIVDQNTIKYTLTIPPGQIPAASFKLIKEVYLYINDFASNEILFAVGQPTEEIRYNADDELTLDVEMAIINLNVLDKFVFQFTQATEISEHNLDPNAHPEWVKAMKKAGIFLPAGAYPFERRGQTFEDNNGLGVEFDGTKASVTKGGVTFTAPFNGTELNGQDINPDGTKTVDELRLEFNAANFPNTVEHNGVGNEVLGAGATLLTGGTYVVQEKDIVYKDVDEVYKRAIADGTIAARAVGVAYRSEKLVVTHGLVDINTGFDISDPVYLSGDTAGALTNFDTNINMGICLGDYIFFSGFSGDVSASVAQQFDAVVTNASGLGQFQTTQLAINAVPNDGRILIAKTDLLRETLNTSGKNISFVFNGPLTGWQRFPGLSSIFRLDFDQVPTQGTFRIEWNFQETNDIPFNATALDIQNEFNLLEGSNGWTITGNFADGFVFESNDLNTYPLPTFNFAGLNEIQRFNFSNIPNDGTITFRHKGQDTLNFPWDDNAVDLELAFEALSTISDVGVTGSFADQFYQIEFLGGFLNDGLQEQPLIQVIQSDLDLSSVTTNINDTTIIPIDALVIQKGKKPASNLFSGSTPINISTNLVQEGEQPGENRAINVVDPLVQIVGMGKISDFEDGIALLAGADKTKIEVYFDNVTNKVLTLDKIPGLDYDMETHGFAKDVFSQLRITEHPTNKKRVKISGADQILASGIILSQELNSLLMKFDGAEIDFGTDPIQVYESDGVTSLGSDIARPVVSAELFRWFSLNIIPKAVNVDQTLEAQVLLLPAASDGISLEAAQKPPFGDKPIGLVAIEGALGDKQLTEIITVKDTFGSLVGKTFILYYRPSLLAAEESVAFWFADPSLDTYDLEDQTTVVGTDQSLFNSTGTKVLAAKISVAAPITVDTIDLYLKKNGNPTGSFTVRLLGDNAGEPDLGNVLASGVAAYDADDLPTNFDTPVRIELDAELNLGAGSYYVEINGDLLSITGGNLVGWNSYDNGAAVEIFNRDPVVNSWSSDLGNRTAKFDLLNKQRGIPVAAQAATREVEITTLAENDLQSVVASKVSTAINADASFSASVNTNRVLVENIVLGDVSDPLASDSGFFFDVILEGTDTDPSGIEDIINKNIRQLGTGSGGGGSGGGPSFLQDLKFQLKTSYFDYLTASVFSADQDAKIASSNGEYSFPDNAWGLDAGDNLQTIDLLDQRFLDRSVDLENIDLTVKFNPEQVDVDTAFEISRDGVNFETVEMESIEGSDTYIGNHKFDDSLIPLVPIIENDDINADAEVILNVTNAQAFAQPFTTLLQKSVLKELKVFVNKLGSPDGYLQAKIVKADTGAPSLLSEDIEFISGLIPVSLLDPGANEVDFGIPNLVLDAEEDYFFIIETDDLYKSSYSNGVDEISLNVDASAPSFGAIQSYDGAAYNIQAGTALTFSLSGREQKLVLRLTSVNGTLIDGFGVFYGFARHVIQDSVYPLENIEFDGDDDVTIIQISQFVINHDTLVLFDLDTGQSWSFPAFSFAGNAIQVPSGTFLREGERIRLKAMLVGGGTFSNDENLNTLAAENHSASLNSNLDKSVAGRGRLFKDGAGNMVEMAIDADGMIAFIMRD